MRLIAMLGYTLLVLAEECDKLCSSYCDYYLPSLKCYDTCNCNNLGALSIPLNLNSIEPTAKANSTQVRDPQQICATTCNLKCKTEVADKKGACVDLCFKQCIASI